MFRASCVAIIMVLSTSGAALAWDPIGDLKDPGRILRNIEREARAAATAAANAAREVAVQKAAPTFIIWLEQSRNTARAQSKPIPASVRKALALLYPGSNALLDRTQYKVGDRGVLNLGSLSIQYGGASAVTLIDTIVFDSDYDAQNNISLWVHEFKHVRQFADWGVRDFAIRYLRDHTSVEDEAYAEQRGYQARMAQLPIPGRFRKGGPVDAVRFGRSTIVLQPLGVGNEIQTFINPNYDTNLGTWLVLDVNQDGCDDLVHIVTSAHYAHTHFSKCDGSFYPPDGGIDGRPKIQFNKPGIANPQGDYNTALGFWTVKYCGGAPVMAHNPQLPDGRNHFWYPRKDGPNRFALSNQCG